MNLILSLSNPDILPETLRTRQVEFGPSGGLIGRADNCDWVLDDPNRFVSSQHVKISFKKDIFYVEDISTNGTYLNDQLIGKGNRMAVATGDRLRVGRFILGVEHIDNDGSVIGKAKAEDPFELLSGDDGRADDDDLLAEAGSTSEIDSFANGGITKPAAELYDDPLPTSSHMPGIKDAMPVLLPKEGADAIPEDWWKSGANDPKPPKASSENLIADAPLESSHNDPLADIPMSKDIEVDVEENNNIVLEPEPVIELEPEPVQESEPVQEVAVEPVVQPKAKAKPKRAKKKPVPVKAPSDGSFEDEFLSAVSLSQENADGETGEILGHVLRELMTGTLDLLDARVRMRNELRLQSTMIGARENNPLKFSINYQDAFGRLLQGESTGFKDPVEATEEVMADLREHQLAMFVGIDAGVKALLNELDPKQISAGKGILAVPTIMSKLSERHAAISEDTVERTGGVFWRAFSDAYQSAIAGAKANRAG